MNSTIPFIFHNWIADKQFDHYFCFFDIEKMYSELDYQKEIDKNEI